MVNEIIEEGVFRLKRDILKYPSDKIDKKIKRIAKKMLGRKESSPDRFFWPHAMMARTLWKYYNFVKDESILVNLELYYNRHKKNVNIISYPDTLMNGYTLIDLYEKTEDTNYGYMLEKMADYVKNASKSLDGSLLYRDNQKEIVYADTIGMVVPFLCRYGAQTSNLELQELAVIQVMNFVKNGLDEESGLPYHAYNSKTKVKYGIIGWGRAVGWILMGVAEGIEYLNDEYKQQLSVILEKMLQSVIKYQREDGFFSWQIQAIDGPADISATCMILGAIKILLGKQMISNEYWNVVNKGHDMLIRRHGAFDECLAECEALSCYPQVYGEYPWGTSMVVYYLLL